MAGCGEGHDEAPEQRVGCEVLCHGEPGDKIRSWVFPEEVANVEDAGDPRVLLALEMLGGLG